MLRRCMIIMCAAWVRAWWLLEKFWATGSCWVCRCARVRSCDPGRVLRCHVIIKQCEGSKNQSTSGPNGCSIGLWGLAATRSCRETFEGRCQSCRGEAHDMASTYFVSDGSFTWFQSISCFFCPQSFQVEELVIQKLNPCKACSWHRITARPAGFLPPRSGHSNAGTTSSVLLALQALFYDSGAARRTSASQNRCDASGTVCTA